VYILVSVRERTTGIEPNDYAEVAASCASFAVRRTSRAVTQMFDEVLQPSGLRVTQFTLLVALAMAGAGSMTGLGRELIMDRTTLARNLRPLQRAGLVTIGVGEDRRERVVRLTPRGEQALATALPLWRQAQARILQGLGPDRWRDLLDTLTTLVTIAHAPSCHIVDEDC
jgi:DNA-binding MarR family transcriptional regulator